MMDETAVQSLQANFRGRLILPSDGDYEAARKVWNGMIDKRPAVIARCLGVADVIAGVSFAREHDLALAVRGGGHNVAGNATCDDGIVIDLSWMRGIYVDPDGRTARAQPGALWGDLDRETQVFGLATTGGVVSHTGIAGLTLGGGLGWLSRSFGTASDNLLSAEVVTASGELVTASEKENAELFWGLRGGGGNFGIVTSFKYRLHPVGPVVLAGPVFFRGEDAPDVLRFYRDFVATAPDEVTVIAPTLTAPPAPFLPAEVHGTPLIGLAVCYVGDPEEGEKVVQPVRSFGRPIVDLVSPMPYTALQSFLDNSYPHGLHYYWKSNYFKELSDQAVDMVVAHAARVTSPLSNFYFQNLGGAISRVPDDATAFGHRNVAFDWTIISAWEAQQDPKPHIAWTRDFWEAMQPFSSEAVYVNNLGVEGEDRVKAAYGPGKFERLTVLKEKYDPSNLFRLNQNIRPSVAAR